MSLPFFVNKIREMGRTEILVALAQIHINVTIGYGFQRVTRFRYGEQRVNAQIKCGVGCASSSEGRLDEDSKFSAHSYFEGGAPGGVRTPDP